MNFGTKKLLSNIILLKTAKNGIHITKVAPANIQVNGRSFFLLNENISICLIEIIN